MPTSPAEFDESMIRRAIRLAMNGRGRVEPNPMVGCVIVKDGRVIGEGFHAKFGEAHAEPTALASCTESPEGATAYVTLEPCCHMNKKTSPCVPRLIDAKIAHVVIGCLDPNPDVDGRGVAMLREAGIEVTPGVLEAEAKQLIAPFIKAIRSGKPYVTLKWAQTADSKVSGPRSSRLQISNTQSSRLVHELRGKSDAILVGINTVITDDPELIARGIQHARPVVRFILDTNVLIPASSKLISTAHEVPVVVFCRLDASGKNVAKIQELTERGVIFVGWEAGRDRIPLDEVMDSFGTDHLEDIRTEPFTHLLVEPGPTLATSFFRSNEYDRLWVIKSPHSLRDDSAQSSSQIPEHLRMTGAIDLAGDTLTEYLNPASPAFFAPEPSADFVLAQEQTS